MGCFPISLSTPLVAKQAAWFDSRGPVAGDVITMQHQHRQQRRPRQRSRERMLVLAMNLAWNNQNPRALSPWQMEILINGTIGTRPGIDRCYWLNCVPEQRIVAFPRPPGLLHGGGAGKFMESLVVIHLPRSRFEISKLNENRRRWNAV